MGRKGPATPPPGANVSLVGEDSREQGAVVAGAIKAGAAMAATVDSTTRVSRRMFV